MRICNVYFLGIVFLLSCEIRHTDLTRAIPGHTWINPVDRMTFVWIKPGSIELLEPFRMGDSVVLNKKTVQFDSGFWMGMTEVMVGEFRKFVEETGYVTTAEKGESLSLEKSRIYTIGKESGGIYQFRRCSCLFGVGRSSYSNGNGMVVCMSGRYFKSIFLGRHPG
jgi:formylglycine-generating enzyme required for sulfatase activity